MSTDVRRMQIYWLCVKEFPLLKVSILTLVILIFMFWIYFSYLNGYYGKLITSRHLDSGTYNLKLSNQFGQATLSTKLTVIGEQYSVPYHIFFNFTSLCEVNGMHQKMLLALRFLFQSHRISQSLMRNAWSCCVRLYKS